MNFLLRHCVLRLSNFSLFSTTVHPNILHQCLNLPLESLADLYCTDNKCEIKPYGVSQRGLIVSVFHVLVVFPNVFIIYSLVDFSVLIKKH